MEDNPPGEGWWQASDGNWYAPEKHPDYSPSAQASPPPPPAGGPPSTALPTAPGVVSGGGGSGKIIAIVVVAVLIAAAAAFALTQGGSDDEQGAGVTTSTADEDDRDDDDDEGRGDEDDEDEDEDDEDDEDEDEGDDEEPDDEEAEDDEPDFAGECSVSGVDSYDDVQVELTFTNTVGDVGSIDVSYAVADGDGERVIIASALIELPRDGEQFRVESDTLDNLPRGVDVDDTSCEILDIEEGFFSDEESDVGDATCAFAELDSADDIQVDLEVTNLFGVTTDLYVTYALSVGDVRFGTATEWIEQVEPDETIADQSDSVTDVPSWVDEDDITCEILAVTGI